MTQQKEHNVLRWWIDLLEQLVNDAERMQPLAFWVALERLHDLIKQNGEKIWDEVDETPASHDIIVERDGELDVDDVINLSSVDWKIGDTTYWISSLRWDFISAPPNTETGHVYMAVNTKQGAAFRTAVLTRIDEIRKKHDFHEYSIGESFVVTLLEVALAMPGNEGDKEAAKEKRRTWNSTGGCVKKAKEKGELKTTGDKQGNNDLYDVDELLGVLERDQNEFDVCSDNVKQLKQLIVDRKNS